MKQPAPLLEILLHDTSPNGDDVGLCAGFERNCWRCEQLAEHIMEWLPEFALNHSELVRLGPSNAVRMVRRAARLVYKTPQYKKRGEFGEVLLHLALRQVFDTIPAISKIYYKSSPSKTVEGFDAVHVVNAAEGLELWLGETKFYDDLGRAIRDVTTEILAHLHTDYLRSEFLLITNKIDPGWPHANELRHLLDPNTSLDEVFERVAIPVLLTYDSDAALATKKSDALYRKSVTEEFNAGFEKLRNLLTEGDPRGDRLPIRIHVILMPLATKARLVEALHRKLKELQG